MHTLTALALSEDNPFFLITGLPVHTLVVHFAVSMLPLSAIALIAIVLVPRWRGAFVWAAMVGLVIGTGAAFISMLSGQALADVIGVPSKHANWGEVLPWVGLALLVVGLIWWYFWRKAVKPDPLPRISMGSGGQLIMGIIAILLSLFTFGLTVVVGHTGAEAVWVTRSLDNEVDEIEPGTEPSAGAATGLLDKSAVAAHNTPEDCWSIVAGNVYDFTAWIPQHPGGAGVVENMCGRDGTHGYENQHKDDPAANAILKAYLIGPLGGPLPGSSAAASAPASAAPSASAAASASASAAPASSAAASGAITAADVATHNSKSDCWSIVNGNVYDLTSWIDAHPGGPGVIEAMCGIDGTDSFNSVHQGQSGPEAALQGMLVGPLG